MTLKVPGYAVILSNVTSSGNTAFWTTSSRVYRFYFSGTFARAAVKLQARIPDGDWVDIPNTTLFDVGSIDVPILRSADYRIAVSGATGTTSISCIALQCYRPDVYMEAEQFLVPNLSPSLLFANGEQGLWYGLNDDATIFQDSAGTTLATWGDPVGLVLDKHEGLAQGAELVVNGTFAANINDWTLATGSGGTIAWSAGSMRVTRTGVTAAGYQALSVVAGTTYKIEVAATFISGTGLGFSAIRPSASVSGTVLSVGTSPVGGSATIAHYYTAATTTTVYIHLGIGVANSVYDFDNVTVKSIAGNHAIQSTSGSRPIRGRMPKRGRVNLLVSTGDVTQAAWTKSEVTATNAFTIVETAASASHVVLQSISIISGQSYTKTLSLQKGVLANAPDVMQLTYGSAGFGATQFATVNVLTGAVVNTAGGATCVALGADPDNAGAWRFRYTATATATTTTSGIGVAFCQNNPTNTRVPSYAGSTTADCRIYKSQSELGSTATAYQHVIDSLGFNITESGQPSCGYLSYNGTNQWMQTAAAVNLTGTDKVSVFAGVRKQTTTGIGVANNIIEQGVSVAANDGFLIGSPGNLGGTAVDFSVGARTGADRGFQGATGYTTPIFAVATCNYDAAETTNLAGLKLRINGVLDQDVQFDGRFGPGNFPNSAVYFGARAGTSLFFNGLMFSTIIRGALTSGTLLTRTEQYVARQTPTVDL